MNVIGVATASYVKRTEDTAHEESESFLLALINRIHRPFETRCHSSGPPQIHHAKMIEGNHRFILLLPQHDTYRT
jgi:hypothetical protein